MILLFCALFFTQLYFTHYILRNVCAFFEEVEKYSDIIEFNVETNNIFIDLATVNDTSLSPYFMFSAVAYFRS